MIPYSNPSDVSISPGVFSAVWHKSYRPLSLDTMLQGLEYPRPPLDRHPSLKRAVRWVLEEKTEAEKLMQRLSRSSSGNAKAALVRAKRFATLGNFYDARLEAERGAK
jgi:hypothetical protein